MYLIRKESLSYRSLRNKSYQEEMESKVKWYNDTQMVGTLLLFWPPLGIYGLYKSETIEARWKNLGYATVALVSVLLAIYLI